MPEKIAEWIEENQAQLIELSDGVWKVPETALKEQASAGLLIDALTAAGFQMETGVAGMPTAFVATYGSGRPVIGILGEYDALPGLSAAAEPIHKPLVPGGPGHGCGHNLLGVAGIGAVLALKEAITAGEIKGTIRYYGCPAEETLTGKVFMVRDGLFDDVDIALTWHPASVNSINLGSDQAMNSAKFKFFGRTAHAAGDPWNGRSALDAVELTNVGANYLREHIIQEGRVHYVITNGGLAPNIVPAEAEVWYYVRAPRRFQVEDIYNRLLKIAEGAAMMTETRFEVEFLTGCYNTLQNNVLCDVVYEKMKTVGAPPFDASDSKFAAEISKTFPDRQKAMSVSRYGPEVAKQLIDKPLCDIIIPPWGQGAVSGGSTDVADVSWVVPTAQFSTACNALGTAGHSWQYAAAAGMGIGHKGMLVAAKVMGLTAAELMRRPELIAQAKEEFCQKTADEPYKSPLPAGLKSPLR
ncbi:MAG: M20 family metallopeptidase [bacterium]